MQYQSRLCIFMGDAVRTTNSQQREVFTFDYNIEESLASATSISLIGVSAGNRIGNVYVCQYLKATKELVRIQATYNGYYKVDQNTLTWIPGT